MSIINLSERIERYKRFHENKKPGQALVYIFFPLEVSSGFIMPKGLDEWNFSDYEENKQYLSQMVEGIRGMLIQRTDIDDDYIPSLYPDYGIAVQSAYLSNAPVIFDKLTSWTEPVINKWDDLEHLVLSEDNFWFKKVSESVCILRDLARDDIIISPMGHLGPMDLANALRGNQLFYDFYDSPEQVHRLLDMCVQTTVCYDKHLKRLAGNTEGDLAIWGCWIPGPAIGMSEDAPDLCSSQIYEEFGKPYTQKLIDSFGNAFIHHHALGLHVHGKMAELNNVRVIQVSNDPNCPAPIDKLDELLNASGLVPILMDCTARDIYDNYELLKRGRTILSVRAKDREEGKRVLDFVRKNLPVF